MRRLCLVLAGGVFVCATAAHGQQYAYPAQGQSLETQTKDDAECAAWAARQTGFDPARASGPMPAQPRPVTGSGARVGGAAAGAVVAGATGGNAAQGAAIGAVGGGVAQRARSQQAATAQNQAAEAQHRALQSKFEQAKGACLSGRGYSVR